MARYMFHSMMVLPMGLRTSASKAAAMSRTEVTGTTDTDGIRMIEAVERTDKTFAVGLQFHPEAAIVKHLEGAENRGDFMDYETALSVFQWIVGQGWAVQQVAA